MALVDGVVLAVDGQDGHVALARGGGEDLAGRNHAFLVGEAHWLAGENRGMRGFKACDANDRGDNEIRLGQGRASDGSLGAVHDFDSRDAGLGQARAQFGGQFFSGHRDDLRSPAHRLCKGFVDVAPGGQRRDRIAVGKLLNYGEGALSDGAGGTEDGESFQSF